VTISGEEEEKDFEEVKVTPLKTLDIFAGCGGLSGTLLVLLTI
jgi:hypothetical protein